MELHVSNMWVADMRGKGKYIKVKGRRWYKQIRKRIREEFNGIRNPLPNEVRKVQAANMDAANTYAAPKYAGKITLFRANRQYDRGVYDETLGWGEYVEGELEIHEIPGHHGALSYEPQARFLAEKMKPCLERSQRVKKVLLNWSTS